MIRPVAYVRRGGALMALLAAAAVACGAQAADEPWEAWCACQTALARLTAARERLEARGDSLATVRAGARARGDAQGEQSLLARGEILVDSLRALSAAGLAQELLCGEVRRRALENLAGEIGRRMAVVGDAGSSAERDTLLARRARLRGAPQHALSAEFEVPEAAEGDPPEMLRERASYARDLADRAQRWLELVQVEEQRLAERRLMAERARLLRDQEFFEDPASARDDNLGLETEGVELRGSVLGALISRMPEWPAAGGSRPERVLELLREWLVSRRVELMERAAALEEQARREGERP